jgi:hypothetical protein
MIERVTRNPFVGKFKAAAKASVAAFTRFKSVHDKGGFALKTLMAAFLGGLGLLFVGSIIEFGESSESIQSGGFRTRSRSSSRASRCCWPSSPWS